MLYLANPVRCRPPLAEDAVRRAMSEQRLGCITTPKQQNPIPAGALWCADNGKFGKGWPGADAWFAWLSDTVARYGPERCLFATAPDVVADAVGTLAESMPWLPRIRELGIPAAFVAQNGCSGGLLPWGEFDVLFLGGDDEFKLGPEGAAVTAEALARGSRVHMGRVNSRKRLAYAMSIGCATADGTFLAVSPANLLRVIEVWFKPLGLPNFDGFDPYIAPEPEQLTLPFAA